MGKEKVKLLIIDDDPKVSWALSEGLSTGFEVLSARDGKEGLKLITSHQPELILLDIKMPNMSGLDVLEKIKNLDAQSDVIMLSGHGDTQNVVESIRRGASEFISKPFDIKEVEIHLHNALEKNRLKKEVTTLRQQLRKQDGQETLIGDSAVMTQIRNIIEQISDSELTVLIRGESGTGKEIVARKIHDLSSRNKQPFVKVNCAAIPRDLLEAELFGYDKGAFTGAHKNKPGRFEVAHKGTIFLDEIGDMSMDLQAKLLQVLEQHEFVRVGGIQNIKVDVRIICATNRNLEKALEKQAMRDDLYYRLNEITVHLPPLRERRIDVPLLLEHFLELYNQSYNKRMQALSPRSLKLLQEYDWPGNVRQLENLIKQVVVRGDQEIIPGILKSHPPSDPEYLPGSDHSHPEKSLSLKKRIAETVTREEKQLIGEVLQKTNWNRRKAAEILEISYRSLLYKIKEYGLGNS
ncbi:MAG: sigma-54 dependent transcriptional regulator [candidate division Zixibacteria bacterium]|nr:sigma-54 dependent transcriptional regulator [candidate division Zixibacteria bacterium]